MTNELKEVKNLASVGNESRNGRLITSLSGFNGCPHPTGVNRAYASEAKANEAPRLHGVRFAQGVQESSNLNLR